MKRANASGAEFNTFCIVCHGPRAEGNGSIVGPGLFPAPPSLHSEAARGFKDGRIFHVITRGQNKMPSYAGDLTPEERWSVVHYVRALQKALQMQEETTKLGRILELLCGQASPKHLLPSPDNLVEC